jgi:hypothetical protein
VAYTVELTDTFGGDANYSWVRRVTINPGWSEFADIGSAAPVTRRMNRRNRQRAIMRAAKRAVGLSGVRGVTSEYGDGFEFRPYGMCQVMFVQWDDSDD